MERVLSPSGSWVREEWGGSRMSVADSAMLDEATALLMREAEDPGSEYGDGNDAVGGGK